MSAPGQEQHPSWEKRAVPGSVLMEFRNSITITNEEETKLGIPEDYQGRSAVAQEAYGVCRPFAIQMVILPKDLAALLPTYSLCSIFSSTH